MSDQITIGEFRVILERIPHKYDRDFIELIILDDDASGTDNAPGIIMKGMFDYVAKPEKKGDVLKLYAGGEALL